MRLVIFDLDGTLIDSVALIVEVMTAAFEAIGEPVPTEAAIRSISGITAREAMQIIVPGADDALIDRIMVSYRAQYQARGGGAGRQPLFRSALETLERLRLQPDTTLAVATGKGFQGATALLTAHGITDWFNSIETPTHHRGKPDPQMIETAIMKAGATQAEAVMIGDTVHDMRMARAAGVKAIGVSWGYHGVDELKAEGADIVIDRFDQLDDAIDRLLR